MQSDKIKNKKFLRILAILFVAIMSGGIMLDSFRPMPPGTEIHSGFTSVDRIEFLHDLTFARSGKIIHEQQIFNHVIKEINKAQNFILIDMFLFNSDYDRKNSYPKLSEQLLRSLIDKHRQAPNVKIYVITDEINDFYGSYNASSLAQLRKAGIAVIVTDSRKLRDSNPVWSVIWRSCFQWFGTQGKGWLGNPLSPDAPKVTLRSYLKMLNFKANHRKVLVTENCAIVQSANPHDASGYHSNTALLVSGKLQQNIIESERKIAAFSGFTIPELTRLPSTAQTTAVDTFPAQAEYLSEGMIKQALLKSIAAINKDGQIDIGMFYLSDRDVIHSLLDASARGAHIRLILDANKDAFGRKKNGIPNRCTADELLQKSHGKIKIRWYDTHGEQFHAKFVMLAHDNQFEIFTGSCNLTRRNMDNFNLESDIHAIAAADSDLAKKSRTWYNRIWNNTDGQYTVSYAALGSSGKTNYLLYRFMEWSGLCTF